MKTLIIGSTLFVLSLGLYLTPDTDKTCHDVGFQLEDKLAGLTNSAQNLESASSKAVASPKTSPIHMV